MEGGWVKLYRKLLDDPLWKNCNHAQKTILITLLLLANHKPNRWIFKSEKYEVKEGEFITSLASLAEETKCSIMQIRTALAKFEKYDFLTYQSTKQNRLIKIKNWAKYQCIEQLEKEHLTKELTKRITKTQQSDNKEVTTNKNDKNDKNIYKSSNARARAREDFYKEFNLRLISKNVPPTLAQQREVDKLLETLDEESLLKLADYCSLNFKYSSYKSLRLICGDIERDYELSPKGVEDFLKRKSGKPSTKGYKAKENFKQTTYKDMSKAKGIEVMRDRNPALRRS